MAFRGVSPTDLEYLLRYRHPFLQIAGVEPRAAGVAIPEDSLDKLEHSPTLIQAETGWVFHYWPANEEFAAAISVSPGLHILNSIHQELDIPPLSIQRQAFETAVELAMIAKKEGWSGMHVLQGSENMRWAAWAAAQYVGIPVHGYEPSEADQKRRERSTYCFEQLSKRFLSNTPTPTMGYRPTTLDPTTAINVAPEVTETPETPEAKPKAPKKKAARPQTSKTKTAATKKKTQTKTATTQAKKKAPAKKTTAKKSAVKTPTKKKTTAKASTKKTTAKAKKPASKE